MRLAQRYALPVLLKSIVTSFVDARRRWPDGVLPREIVTSWKKIYSELASEENGNAMRLVLEKTTFLCNVTNRTRRWETLHFDCRFRGDARNCISEAALRDAY